MKFGDIVTAVALWTVITVLISFSLVYWLISVLGVFWAFNFGWAVSILVGALITGYMFAGRMREDRWEAIGKILILTAVLQMVLVAVAMGVAGDWTPAVKEGLSVPELVDTTYEWVLVEVIALSYQVSQFVAMVLTLGFIGLYFGSTLRQVEQK